MQLPHANAAVVSQDKILEYLLNPLHPDGASKSRFFLSRGFSAKDWQVLSEALQQLAKSSSVVASVDSVHGWKYIVDGTIETPSGRPAEIRTVWIVDRGEQIPRLVTAYPHK